MKLTRLPWSGMRKRTAIQKAGRPLLILEELEGRLTPSTLIPLTTRRDLIYDASRQLLYITTSAGTVERFSTGTQSLLSNFAVGTSLNGGDITADGTSLYVAENQPTATQGIIHKVNLGNGTVSNITYTLAFGEAGAWDVAISSNGKGLVTTQFAGSGWVPLRQLAVSTDTLSVRTDDPGSGFGGQVRQNTLVGRGADRSLFLLPESNISSGPLFSYSAATDSFPEQANTGQFLGNNAPSVSRDGSLIAIELSGGLAVMDSSFHAVVNLTSINGGVAFDPVRDVLYGVNTNAGQIIAYDTHTWAEKFRLGIGETPGFTSAFGNGVMAVSSDGSFLFLATPSGVREYNLPANTGIASTLKPGGFPSFIGSGTAGSFTVSALDPAGNVATGYTGTVHFTSSDGLAGLPADYAFTAADQGVHTFSATLASLGSQSLSVADAGDGLAGMQSNISVHGAAVSLIPVANHRDLVFDPVRGLLYITTSGGTVERYDPASGTLLAPYQLGDPLNGADISADGSALYVADNQPNVAQGFVDKISLATGTVSRPTYALMSGEAGSYDVAIGSNGKGLVTTRVNGSGWVPLRQLVVSTDTLSARTDDPGSGGSGQVRQNTRIGRGADRSLFLLTESNISSGPIFNYAALTDTFPSKVVDTNAFVDNSSPAVNRNGALQALDVFGSGIQIYDAALNLVKTLSGVHGGLLFDPIKDLLYVANSSTNQIVAYDTNTWNQTFTFNIGETLSSTSAFGNGVMAVTADGRTLFLATASGIRVFSLPNSALVVGGFPSPDAAGSPGMLTVRAVDGSGNTLTAYTGTVHFMSTDANATLPADYTFTAGDQGVHTFSATLKTAGVRAITAVDAGNHLGGTEFAILVDAGPAAKLLVAGFPTTTIAGGAHTFTVTLLDAFGNVADGYRGTVHFTSSDTKAALPANYTFTSTDAGQHVFLATLKTAGTRSISANDTLTLALKGSDTGIVVNPGPTSQLAVTGFPSPIVAGTTGTFTVTARDAFGNRTPGYTGTAHFTSNDSKALVPANYTFTAADAGVHTFTDGATLFTAGLRTIVATDPSTLTITGKQTVTVQAAAAVTLTVSGFVSATTAGAGHTFTVSARDVFGNVATSYVGTVHFTSSDPQAFLPADYTFVAADKGKHTFTAILKITGKRSLTATDMVTASITGTQAGITVNPAAASMLAVSGFPTSIMHGVSASFTVTALDAFGNLATGYRGIVHFTSSDGAAALPANYTFTAGDAGKHTFSATLNTVGTQSMTATDTVTATITGTESGIQVAVLPLDAVLPEDDSDSGEHDGALRLGEREELPLSTALAAMVPRAEVDAVLATHAVIEPSTGAQAAVLALVAALWRDSRRARKEPD
jgi:sugar lactone lactonase YvrE